MDGRFAPQLAVVVRRQDQQCAEDQEWQGRQTHRRHAALSRHSLDPASHLEARPQHARQVAQQFAQVAAGLGLNGNGDDHERKIILTDAHARLVHGAFQVQPVCQFVGGEAEFGADRIIHFACHHGDCDRQRVASLKAAHHDVDGFGQLFLELGATALPQVAQDHDRQTDAASKSRQHDIEPRVTCERRDECRSHT